MSSTSWGLPFPWFFFFLFFFFHIFLWTCGKEEFGLNIYLHVLSASLKPWLVHHRFILTWHDYKLTHIPIVWKTVFKKYFCLFNKIWHLRLNTFSCPFPIALFNIDLQFLNRFSLQSDRRSWMSCLTFPMCLTTSGCSVSPAQLVLKWSFSLREGWHYRAFPSIRTVRDSVKDPQKML